MGNPVPMETAAGSWDFVIKVKYGESLKRFNGSVTEGFMEYNMNMLRNKIVNLFQLNQDPELVLTYFDEDGELVTLESDDELHDAVITQHLNPLRITVQLIPKSGGEPELKPEILSSIISRHLNLEQPSQVRSIVEQVLKSLPESLQSTIVQAALSSPALASLVEAFSKFGLSNVNQRPSSFPGDPSGMPSGEPAQTDKARGNASAATGSSSSVPAQHESVQLTQDGMVKGSSIDLNVSNVHSVAYPSIDDLMLPVISPFIKRTDQYKETDATNYNEKSIPAVAAGTVEVNNQKPSLAPTFVDDFTGMFAGSKNKQVANGASSSTLEPDFGFAGTAVNMYDSAAKSGFPYTSGLHSMGHPFRRFHGHHDNLLHTFHRGVQCDGCGMHPIIGPRFKSKVKDDYDLCNICFSRMGNEADYIRIDKAHHLSHRMLKEINKPHFRRRFPLSHLHGVGAKHSRAKLESRFIQDVTVLDGTIIPPSTPFTKIWRMRNNGNTRWPYGTQIVWVGGDQFANTNSVGLEIDSDGFPEDEEIDVAVDFTSPSMPGRYVSYWRLASPSGQKFGQRVWVLIQVDNNVTSSAAVNLYPEINLNLPPGSSNLNGGEITGVGADPVDDFFPVAVRPEVLVEPAHTKDLVVNQIPTNSPESASEDAPVPAVTPPQPYPVPEVKSSSETLLIDVESFTELPKDDKTVEQTLLKELEEMGFKQIDLNKEILRNNGYDLEQSVDDLCDYAEWDPLLAELHEMGFSDATKNKKLLTKYGGSIKRVVMDLIAEEKAELL